MGSVKHPAAEQARNEFEARNFDRALEAVEDGLTWDPGNPDLACEAAILAIYRAQEEHAFELLPLCEKGLRFEKLTSLLADFYTSRILADRSDHDARRRLQLVRTFHPKESKHIGVRICACLIVKNEESTLGRCLSSLQDRVDQIVVVDTGSTDGTIEVAARFDTRVAHFEWCDDFSAARNFAMSFAKASWILVLDADEELTPQTKSALDRAVIRPQFGGFEIDIVNYLEEAGDREQFRHSTTRLFRNLPGVTYSGRIHEQVNPSLLKLGLPWARLDGATIIHHGYRPSVMSEKMKVERSISLLTREVEEDPANSFQWFNLANVYLVSGRAKDAATAARTAIQQLGPFSGVKAPAYSVLIQSLRKTGEWEEALRYADEAVEKGLDSLQIAFEKCGVLLDLGRVSQALAQSEHMMSMAWHTGDIGDAGIWTHKRFVVRAQALFAAGELNLALAAVDHALAAVRNYGPAWLVRGQILLKSGNALKALEAFQSALQDRDCSDAATAFAAESHEVLGELESAAQLRGELWSRHVDHLNLWLDWRRCCELSGNTELVLNCFEQLAAVQRMSAEYLVDWGRALARSGDSQSALRCFAEAMQADPTHANAYFNCGDVLAATGMPDRAATLFEAGLSLQPGYPEGWFVLGNALAHCSREPDAISAYQKVLELDPGHDRARRNLETLQAA